MTKLITNNEVPDHCLLAPAHPYTEYNIFFQLEREYILQVLFQVEPTVELNRVFDPSNAMYEGPRMPSRYCMLVLSDDWYVPGKNRRRKRKHTKTHGKISFCDLSKSIAQAWSNTSAEIREYCENLCDIG